MISLFCCFPTYSTAHTHGLWQIIDEQKLKERKKTEQTFNSISVTMTPNKVIRKESQPQYHKVRQ